MTGANGTARANQMPTTRATTPVLPPSTIPEALSTYVVTVLVPRQDPMMVPTESTRKAMFVLPFGILP